MVHWYSFGECSCPAHTIMDVRFESQSEDFAPVCPVAICPDCAMELKFRASWPATSDGFGGSSGLLEELVARAKRIADKYGDEYPDIANLGVIVDAWEAQREPRPKFEHGEAQLTLDSIADGMKCSGLPTAYVYRVAELARRKESAADLVYLWHESTNDEEREAIEYDLFRVVIASDAENPFERLRMLREAVAKCATPEEASVRHALPLSVVRRLLRSGAALSYIGVGS